MQRIGDSYHAPPAACSGWTFTENYLRAALCEALERVHELGKQNRELERALYAARHRRQVGHKIWQVAKRAGEVALVFVLVLTAACLMREVFFAIWLGGY